MVDQQLTGAVHPAGPCPAAPRRRPVHTLAERLIGTRGPAGWIAPTALPAAIALWVTALRGTRLDRMGDLGLLEALPRLYWAAFAVLLVGFVAVLYQPRLRRGWPAAYVVTLIAMIHATPSILYPTLRYAWAWKHIAVVDAMLRHHGTVPNAGGLEIYNEWPGFFQLNVLFLRATGLHSALGYASWYPFAANLLLLGPLLMLYRALTRSRRLIWGGVWLYYSASWVGQDYFSPQAFAYLLFVLVLALVLGRLAVLRRAAEAGPVATAGPPPEPPPEPPSATAPSATAPSAGAPSATALSAGGTRPRALRPGWYVLVLVLIAGIVVSHPLTPVMLISVLTLLSLRRRNRRTVLPVLAAAVGMTFAWDSTVAHPYLSQHIDSLVAGLSAADSNVRPPGQLRLGTIAPDQALVSWLALGMSGVLGLLALTALITHRWVRRTGLMAVLFGPLPLLLANSYGGEMILRAYLFVLPATAFLAATVVLRAGRRPGVDRVVAVFAAAALAIGMFGNYYSKEAMNYFSPEEVAALHQVTGVAPPGSRIVSVTGDLPGGEMHYDDRTQVILSQLPAETQRHLLADPLPVLRRELTTPAVPGPSYLVLTRAQAEASRLTGLLPDDTVRRLADLAAASPEFRAVYVSPDAVVYEYAAPAPAAGGPAAPAGATPAPDQVQPSGRQP